MNKVDIFHIGPQKSGTTWLYEALKQHPQISTSAQDSVHYFDLHFCHGESWYASQIKSNKGNLLFDPTYTYIRAIDAPKRIFHHNPNAKIILTARNPLERAFSHYWHEKKKDRFNFSFSETLENYDLFSNWIEPGFYASHLKRFLEYFPENQILVMFFDDLQNDPHAFYRQLCTFCSIDMEFMPLNLNAVINPAGKYKSYTSRQMELRLSRYRWLALLIKVKNRLLPARKTELLANIEPQIKEALLAIFEDDICELEALTGRDLSSWKSL